MKKPKIKTVPLNKIIGNKVKERRTKLSLSMDILSTMTGISRSNLYTIESGKGCNSQSLDKLCKALEINISVA